MQLNENMERLLRLGGYTYSYYLKEGKYPKLVIIMIFQKEEISPLAFWMGMYMGREIHILPSLIQLNFHFSLSVQLCFPLLLKTPNTLLKSYFLKVVDNHRFVKIVIHILQPHSKTCAYDNTIAN